MLSFQKVLIEGLVMSPIICLISVVHAVLWVLVVFRTSTHIFFIGARKLLQIFTVKAMFNDNYDNESIDVTKIYFHEDK